MVASYEPKIDPDIDRATLPNFIPYTYQDMVGDRINALWIASGLARTRNSVSWWMMTPPFTKVLTARFGSTPSPWMPPTHHITSTWEWSGTSPQAYW